MMIVLLCWSRFSTRMNNSEFIYAYTNLHICLQLLLTIKFKLMNIFLYLTSLKYLLEKYLTSVPHLTTISRFWQDFYFNYHNPCVCWVPCCLYSPKNTCKIGRGWSFTDKIPAMFDDDRPTKMKNTKRPV